MQRSATTRAASPESLAQEWFAAYAQESADEEGDADAFIRRLRDVAEGTVVGSDARQAFALLLERLRAADVDLDMEDERR